MSAIESKLPVTPTIRALSRNTIYLTYYYDKLLMLITVWVLTVIISILLLDITSYSTYLHSHYSLLLFRLDEINISFRA